MVDAYRTMRMQLEAEIAQLEQRREEFNQDIDGKIDNRKKLLADLGALEAQGDDGASPAHVRRERIRPEMGIIKAVGTALRSAGRKRVLPTEVRDTMVSAGFRNTENLLPEIHAALRRLADREEARPIKVGTKTAYVYTSKKARNNGTS